MQSDWPSMLSGHCFFFVFKNFENNPYTRYVCRVLFFFSFSFLNKNCLINGHDNADKHRWENLIASANIWWMLKYFFYFTAVLSWRQSIKNERYVIFGYIVHVKQINFCLIFFFFFKLNRLSDVQKSNKEANKFIYEDIFNEWISIKFSTELNSKH